MGNKNEDTVDSGGGLEAWKSTWVCVVDPCVCIYIVVCNQNRCTIDQQLQAHWESLGIPTNI